jgi:S1-C subfamily serine protease
MNLKYSFIYIGLSLFLLLFGFLAGMHFAPQLTPPSSWQVSAAWPVPQVVQKVSPKVVTVSVLSKESSGHPDIEVSAGSGFIYLPNYILTNYHVVGKAKRAQITYADGRKELGKVIGHDFETDVAVIKVKEVNTTPLTIGDSSRLQVGELVLTVGSPQHLERTVTSGIISALNRTLSTGARTFVGLIQTDAPINFGSSGGPLINLRGEVIGVNTLIGGGDNSQGIAFALPINQVKEVASRLIAGQKVEHAFAGLTFADLNERQAEKAGLKAGLGALIVHVAPGTPAFYAGLKKGDIVVAANDQQIKDSNAIIGVIRGSKVGAVLKVKVKRGSKLFTKFLKLVAKPQP